LELGISSLSLEDMYGAKLVTVMGRRHSRDLCDMMQRSLRAKK
jgi:hypothetical protein